MSLRQDWMSLRSRMGQRGDFLFGLFIVDMAQALTLMDGTGTATEAWFGSVLPLWIWAAIWALAGAACLAFSFQRDDHIAYVVAIGVKVIWGIGSLAAWILTDVTPIAGVLWLVFARMVWRVSVWAEPIIPPEVAEGDDQA